MNQILHPAHQARGNGEGAQLGDAREPAKAFEKGCEECKNSPLITWSFHDPLKIGSFPKIMGSWTHFFRVMETPGSFKGTRTPNPFQRETPNMCVCVFA